MEQAAGPVGQSLPRDHDGGGCGTLRGLQARDAITPTAVNPIAVLGHGRAAEARLVEVSLADGRTQRCVEKVFRPGLLTRTIYRACFQAPFGYQDNADAILASYYRRRVAWALCRVFVPDVDVARPLYVRWDHASAAMVLASEWVIGRGILPPATDPRMLRRWLGRFTGRQSDSLGGPPAEEIKELLDAMQRLESLLLECGLTGTGWQVCQRAIVSTANLLRTPRGYVAIDLESGIPSMLVSTYLMAGVRQASLPLFDDLDASRLRRWIADHRRPLAQRLRPDQLQCLDDDVERLIEHSERWKQSEPAVLRRPWRLASRRFSEHYRRRVLDSWTRRRIVDSASEQRLRRPGARFFSTSVFWLGLLPGKAGRCLQRLRANHAYRRDVKRFVTQRDERRQRIARATSEAEQRLRCSGRVAPSGGEPMSPWQAAWHTVLAKLTPVGLHRWLVDPQQRCNSLARISLLLVSRRFQSGYGRLMIRRRIVGWEKQGRLTAAEAAVLHRQLDCGAIDQYVRGFGLHVGLKLLLPVVLPLKAGGIAASLASGNPLYFLFMLMLMPVLRTGVTLWQRFAAGRPWGEFRDALIVGLLPVLGSLAFPVQMYSRVTDLSTFMLRDFAARLGRLLPIYGGKDSRTELAAIKSVNLVAEVMEIWLTLLRSPAAGSSEMAAIFNDDVSRAATSLCISRWDHAAIKQLRLVAAELGLESGAVPSMQASDQPPRRAAS